MRRLVFYSILSLSLFHPLVWANPLQEDNYFQDVSSEEWRRYDERNKAKLRYRPVEIIDPVALQNEFEKGLKWEEKGDFKRALKAFKKTEEYAPQFPLSAEILWRTARCQEKLFRWVEAFDTYAQLYKEYPAYDNAWESPKEQFRIAKIMEQGNTKVVMSYATDQFYFEIAQELFQRLQNQIPKTETAGFCQYEIAKIDEKKKKYREASDAYYKVILNYPHHPLVPKALFLSGVTASKVVRGASYDAGAIEVALSRLGRFITEFSEDKNVSLAKEILLEMKELQAEKLFITANYYVRENNFEAAKIYFDELKEKYPESEWAQKGVI